jgi:peptidoglycan/LPS O-acetylase OafA/YrhL
MQPTHKYLLNLTPLRGIAALWVVVFHFSEIAQSLFQLNIACFLQKAI